MAFLRECGNALILLLLQIDTAGSFPSFGIKSTNFFNRDVGYHAAPFCADLDADGDVDCLVGDSDGWVEYFEGLRSPSSSYSWTVKFTNFFSYDVGSWASPFCIDLDGDGVVDCLVGDSTGFVSHFRWAAFTWLRVTHNVFGHDVGSSAKPFCADMDGDGLVDCLVGAGDGRVYFMKRNAGSGLSFTESGAYFAQRDFGANAAVNCVDVDGDRALDCFVGNSAGYISLLQRDSLGNWVEQSTNIFNHDFGSHAVPFCVDLEEGLVDCLVGNSDGVVSMVEQRKASDLTFFYEGFILSDIGSRAAPACVDLDQDGNLDVVVGGLDGYVDYFQNSGAGLQFSHVETNVFGAPVSSRRRVSGGDAAPTCLDMDGDGDMDCIVGSSDGVAHYFQNVGSGWSNASGNIFSHDVGENARPFCANFTGHIDCLVGAYNGFVHHFRQTGPSSFQHISSNYFGRDVGSYAAPTCTDLDRDGWLDCLVGESGGYVAHFRNSTSGWVHTTNDFFRRDFGSMAVPFCADLQADGLMDCLVGESNGQIHHLSETPKSIPKFTWEVSRAFSDVGSYAKPTCADVDQDGAAECLVGNYDGYVRSFERTGLASFTFRLVSTNFLAYDVGDYAAPFCFDIDDDGDTDCLVGNGAGRVYHFRNNHFAWTFVTSDFFSLGVGTHAVPFCVDMDGDGDQDCMVGNSAGYVHYWRRDSDSWTYVSDNLFQYDVGSYATPFCLDLDRDGDVDCLVGEHTGYVVLFRNVGSPSSYKWETVTPHYFLHALSYTAPFCLDIDADGDLDCLVGVSDGSTHIFKAQESNVSRCQEGSYPRDSDGVCLQCPSGKYAQALTCTTCPPGTMSEAGSSVCQQTFADWLKNLSTVQVSAEHDGLGQLNFRIQMPLLPTDLHSGLKLAYDADLQSLVESGRELNPNCSALWEASAQELVLSVEFEQLWSGTSCTMDVNEQGNTTVLTGNAVLAVRGANDGNRVIHIVVLPLELSLPKKVRDGHAVHGGSPTVEAKSTWEITPFASNIKIFYSESFDTPVVVPYFQEGDRIFVQHSISPAAGQTFEMTLFMAFLSSSPDFLNEAALKFRLEKTLTNLSAPTGQVRFSFLAEVCADCVLHVVSQLSSVPWLPPSRRLEQSRPRSLEEQLPGAIADQQLEKAIREIANTSLALQIVPKANVAAPTELYGTLELAVEGAELAAFAADPRAQQAIASALRAYTDLPAEVRVIVGLSIVAVRRLSAGAFRVRAAYMVVVPASGLPDGRMPADIAAALNAASLWALGLAINAALSSYKVSVVSRTPATLTLPSTVVDTTQPSALDDNWGSYMMLAVGCAAGGVAMTLVCVVVLLRHRICGGKMTSNELAQPAGKQWCIETMDTEAPPSQEVGCSLVKVTDTNLLLCLSDLLHCGGSGSQQQRLVLKGAWSVHVPAQQAAYKARRATVAKQLQMVSKAQRKQRTEPTDTLTDDVAEKLGVDASCNEKVLLHCARVRTVQSILRNGIGEGCSSEAAFGFGVYFAEDCRKIDEEAEVDLPDANDDETRRLHQVLYEGHGDAHPGEVCYAFACGVCLGCPVYTKGPALPGIPISTPGPGSSEEGVPVFANKSRQELAPIPGTWPPILYHSLVVEEGAEQHRRFVLFDGEGVLVKYLIAYAREPIVRDESLDHVLINHRI